MKTFKGGIHPPEYKELSRGKKIERAFPATKTVTIPVTMGGAPNVPVVSAGEKVSRGQVIAKSQAFVSAPVHSSVSGTVKKIVSNLSVANAEVPCIVIQADEEGRESFMPPLDPLSCTKEEALARVKEAGICGMGGASFPTHVKLNPPKECKIDFLLLNAAECEPYLTVDEETIFETPQKVLDGLLIVQKILCLSCECDANSIEVQIVLESNKKHLVPKLQEAIENFCGRDFDSKNENSSFGGDEKISQSENQILKEAAKKIKITLVKTKYPQGAEKNIITAATGRKVPAGKLPSAAGCVVCNVGTVCAISEAFREGKPLIDRAFTVSGGGVKEPKNLLVPIGTLASDLIPSQIELGDDVAKILSGGPMMGFSMQSAAFPIQKGTSGILFLSKNEIDTTETGPCLGCAKCVGVCPMRLTPVMIVRSVKTGHLSAAKKYGLMDCVECGSCAYICPASVPIVQMVRIGKSRERAALQKNAALSR